MAVGGYDGNHYLKTVEEYDPEANEWDASFTMTYSRAGALKRISMSFRKLLLVEFLSMKF
ncbi:hypothetical protein DOY81_011710 [Sarcophaga bullata]|nr:hypothetical protein DOY81_011710 [Sarcophaga bullata]